MESHFLFGKGQYKRSLNSIKRNRVSQKSSDSIFDVSLFTSADDQINFDVGLENDTYTIEEELNKGNQFTFHPFKEVEEEENPELVLDFINVEFDNFLQGAKLIQGDIEEEVRLFEIYILSFYVTLFFLF